METKGHMRRFSTGRIAGFRRHSPPEIPLHLGERPIIILYVNFLPLFRSRLEPITDDFDGRSLRLAAQPSGSGLVVCSPGAGGFHSRSITVASDRSRSRITAPARERESEKGKSRIPGTVTASPLDHLVSGRFFDILRPFLSITIIQAFLSSSLMDRCNQDGVAGSRTSKPLNFVTFSKNVTRMLQECYSSP